MLARGHSFAQVHYKIISNLVRYGDKVPTDYDSKKELPSVDAPFMVEVLSDHTYPVFSKCVYDSAEGLLDYRAEIVEGIHDDMAEQLSYTYHDRLEGQFSGVISELERNAYTRRAQMITWVPEKDLGDAYPPCLQRVWFRKRRGKLDMHTHWRSRDAFKAWGSNVFGLYFLFKKFAEEVDLPMGMYREFVDSMHIYGRDRTSANNLAQRPFSDWEWPLEVILKEAGEG